MKYKVISTSGNHFQLGDIVENTHPVMKNRYSLNTFNKGTLYQSLFYYQVQPIPDKLNINIKVL